MPTKNSQQDLFSAKGALAILRAAEESHTDLSWELIISICEVHFRDRFPVISKYLKYRNTTGLAWIFEEEARTLTPLLWVKMTIDSSPLSAIEAEEGANRIALLSGIAHAVKLLHVAEYDRAHGGNVRHLRLAA